MKLKNFILSAILSLAATVAAGQDNPVSWRTESKQVSDTEFEITFHASIPKPWHMYDLEEYVNGPNPTVFTFDTGSGANLVGGITSSVKPTRVYDEMFGMEIGYFSGTVKFTQRVKLSAAEATVRANVEWMVCDEGMCLPPEDIDFTLRLKPSTPPAAAVQTSATSTIPSAGVEAGETPQATAAEADKTAVMETAAVVTSGTNAAPVVFTDSDDESGGTMWAIILAAMGWGLMAIFTPCVFPMIPMTVSMFLKSGDNPRKGRFQAIMYGVFIILLYTIPIAALILITRIVGGETVTADIFNWLATHWLPNVIFFLVFMVFAASFFGAFEITMPSWLVNKSDRKADRGGLGGVFFLALTLVLVSFSCTGPLVGSALIASTTGGEFIKPIVTILIFSIVFALPFMFFAVFPSLLSKLPKSGGWLNSVKVVLGFIEVALGFKFLSVADQTYHWGILDREVYLAIWIVVFALMGLYLLGKLKFAHDSDLKYISVPRLGLAIVTFSFVVYLVPGMWGAPLKGISGYLPPLTSQDFVAGSGAGKTSISSSEIDTPRKYSDFLHLPHGLDGFFDYYEALEYSRAVGKPLFVDFTGHGCVNCREMEARVWADERVLTLLRDEFVIVALYSDDKKTLLESDWVVTDKGKTLKSLGKINSYLARTKFNANAQPYYLILDGDETQLARPRGYDLDIDAFVKFLRTGIDNFNARHR